LSDEQIVECVRAGQTEAFEVLLRRHNQRVHLTARSVLHDDAEAEEVAQEAWVRAFDHLEQYAGRGQFAIWVGRIALREACRRARRARKGPGAPRGATAEERLGDEPRNPEQAACDREVAEFLQLAIEALPEKYRLVFVLRVIEGLSTGEAALSLR